MFTHRHDGLTRNEPRPSAEADLCAAAPRARCALRYCPSPPLKFSPTVPAVDLVDCVGRVLELRTLDLATQPPPSPGPAALPVVGYDFLALYLSVTEEFDDNVQVLEVLERFEQDCASLEEALSRLWGPAESVDLRPYMDLMVRGETVPELPGFLLGVMSDVAVWRFADRSICVGVGVSDTHGPMVLVAAAGEL